MKSIQSLLLGSAAIVHALGQTPYAQVDFNALWPPHACFPETSIPSDQPGIRAELTRIAALFRFKDSNFDPRTGTYDPASSWTAKPGQLHYPGGSHDLCRTILLEVGVTRVTDHGGGALTPHDFFLLPRSCRPSHISFWSANLLLLALEKVCRNLADVPVRGDLNRMVPIAVHTPEVGAWVGLLPLMYWWDDQNGHRFRIRKGFLYYAFRAELPLQSQTYATLRPHIDHFQGGGTPHSPAPVTYAPTGHPTRSTEARLLAKVLQEQTSALPSPSGTLSKRIRELLSLEKASSRK